MEKFFQINDTTAIKFLSPNFMELKALYEILTNGYRKNDENSNSISKSEIIEIVEAYSKPLFKHINGLHSIICTVDKLGLIYVGPNDSIDQTISLGPDSNLFQICNNNNNHQIVHMMQEPVDNLVNVSGAGDCLVGATIYGWLNQWTYRKSLELGLKAARLSIRSFETIPKNLHEILK